MGRGRAVPPSASAALADDCNSGEVDWALADMMIGTLLYAAGGPACVLKGRIQVGQKLGRRWIEGGQKVDRIRPGLKLPKGGLRPGVGDEGSVHLGGGNEDLHADGKVGGGPAHQTDHS